MKAKAQQAKLKMAIYGTAGSGKTFTALLIAEGLAKREGKRIAYVDSERGTDFYTLSVNERPVHPTAFDFDALYTKSLSQVLRDVQGLDLKTYGVIVIDSISHLWESAIEAYSGYSNKADNIPMHAWGKIKKPYKKLISDLMGLNVHVLVLGRQKNVFSNDAQGQLIKEGVTMKSEGESAYEFNQLMRMECHAVPGARAEHTGFVEKDRSGLLAGRLISWPNYDTIHPILELLDGTQVEPEDDDERIAQDAELLRDQERAADKKADKSKGLFDQMVPVVRAAGNLEDLGSVAASIKKQRRYLTGEHQEALRVLYLAKRDDLAQTRAGDNF